MINVEEGKRYSEDVYASKAELSAAFNGNVDSLWDKVLTYRQFFDVQTDLSDSSSNRYKICLTKRIQSQAYALERRVMRLTADHAKLSKNGQKKLYVDELERTLHSLCSFSSLSISRDSLSRYARGEIESIPPHLLTLKTFIDAYSYAFKSSSFSLQLFEEVNNILSGVEFDKEASYRKEAVFDAVNPLKDINPTLIKEHLGFLLTTLNDETIPLIIRAGMIIYCFSYLRPFTFCNEETASILAKAFLKSHDLDAIGFYLPLEAIAFSTSSSYFNRLKVCESSLDITYFIASILPFLSSSVETLDSDIKARYISDNENVNRGVEHNENFALPVFPIDNDEQEIEALTLKLLEVYPALKRRQAHFFAGHCQVGLNYTIEQFKKEEKTVYETARTSMEDLANRGFYVKKLIGKKFVYTPVPLNLK